MSSFRTLSVVSLYEIVAEKNGKIKKKRKEEVKTMIAKVIGYKKFTSKKGNDMCVLNLTYDFSGDEKEKLGAVGSQVFSGFVPRGFDISVITEKVIGAEVDATFSFYNNQMNLVHLDV